MRKSTEQFKLVVTWCVIAQTVVLLVFQSTLKSEGIDKNITY